jgi:hypothetical protein
VSCRIRVINLNTKRVSWSHPPDGYLGAWSVDHPQRALLYAECIIAAWGDEVVRVIAVDLLHDPEEDLGGILVRGEKIGVLIEGADI